MRILFTGASSFTGMHFVLELLKDGHEVTCTFSRKGLFEYSPEEQVRISRFWQHTKNRFRSPFGSGAFNEILDDGFDVVCLHGARGLSGGGPSSDFDVIGAVDSNTWNAASVMRTMKRAGIKRVVLTGTYFEKHCGRLIVTSNFLPPENAYALSKTLTSEIIKFYCDQNDIRFNKFVVPNPFGLYENKRFTTTAAMSWLNGKHVTVESPLPVRDNIHVDLLSLAYAKYISERDNADVFLAPRGYVMGQGQFAMLFAQQMRQRFGLPCPVDFADNDDVGTYRANTTYAAIYTEDRWNEKKAWDNLADYYISIHKK